MIKRLAILGASGHGRVVADAAECIGTWSEIVFFDDTWPEQSQNGIWAVHGDTNVLLSSLEKFDGVIVAIGDNRVRRQKLAILLEKQAPITSIFHPTAVVSRHTNIGFGCALFAGTIVNVDSKLGIGCIVNTGATIDHDCVLGDCVHVSPGAHLAGGVSVGEQSWIGIGAIVRQSIIIGREAMVGAGATVVKSVPDNVTVVGTPARIVK